MNELKIALAIVAGVIVLFFLMDIYGRQKLKRMVAYRWGRQPHQTRLDKEESLKQAWHTEKAFRKADSEVDDITWYDLDMFAIFDLINATYSSVGSEALYQRLRNFDLGKADKTEALIAFYEKNPHIRENVQYHFARLGKQDNNFTKDYPMVSKKSWEIFGPSSFLAAYRFSGSCYWFSAKVPEFYYWLVLSWLT